MDRATFYMGLTILWFTFAGYIVMVADWKSGRALAAVIAVMFGLFNLIRYLLEGKRPERRETPTDEISYETRNPDFDFNLREKELDDRSGAGP